MSTTGRLLAAVAALLALAALAATPAPARGGRAQAATTAQARRTLELFTNGCDTRQTPNTSWFRWRRGDDSPKEANHRALVASLVPGACAAAGTAESRRLDLPLANVRRLAFDFKQTNADAHYASTLGSRIQLRLLTPDPIDPSQQDGFSVDLIGALCDHPMTGHPGWAQAHFSTDRKGCTILLDDGSDYQQPFSADGAETAWQKLVEAFPQGRIEAASFLSGINRSRTRRSFRYDRISIGTGVVWDTRNWGTPVKGL